MNKYNDNFLIKFVIFFKLLIIGKNRKRYKKQENNDFDNSKCLNLEDIIYKYIGNKNSNSPDLNNSTQNIYVIDKMQIEQLHKKGVNISYEIVDNGQMYKTKYINIQEMSNEKFSLYRVFSKNIYKKCYYLNNIYKYQIIEPNDLYYDIINYKKTITDYCCPNCGFVNNINSYIDGCPYCGSKFDIHNASFKINGFGIYLNGSRSLPVIGMLVWFTYIFIFPILLSFLIKIVPDLYYGNNSLQVLLFSFVIGFIIYHFIVARIYYAKNEYGQCVANKLKKKILKNDANFSLSEFFSSLEAKLKVYYISDLNDSLRNMVPDINVENRNIIDLNIVKHNYYDYYCVDKYEYINCNVTVRFVYLDGEKIFHKDKVCKIRLKRNKSITSNLKSDIESYKCTNCGSSMAVYNGMTCKYCNTKYDYSDYDFKIDYIK